MLKGNTHAHTQISDGRKSPEKMLREYKKNGHDFTFLTDHQNKEEPYDYPNIDGIVTVQGCEVSSGEHYVYAKANDEEIKIKAHPNRYDDPINEVEEWDLYEATEHAQFQSHYMKCRGNYPIFSDDSHSLGGVGQVGILVEANRDPVSIIKNIKQGNFRLWVNEFQSPLSIIADYLEGYF